MHFLRKDEVHGRAIRDVVPSCGPMGWACVKVKLEAKDRLCIVVGSIGVLKPEALVAPLPKRMKVVTDEGEQIAPSEGKRFYVTVNSFNPNHALVEAPV